MDDPKDPRQTPATAPTKAEPARDAEVSALARHGDPSLPTANAKSVNPKGRAGIEWVRVSELLTSRGQGLGSRLGKGQEASIRKIRGQLASWTPISRRGIARRSAASLPPVSSFGARTTPASTGRQVVSI